MLGNIRTLLANASSASPGHPPTPSASSSTTAPPTSSLTTTYRGSPPFNAPLTAIAAVATTPIQPHPTSPPT
ncbi:hypothetical protein K525DRAFT_275386 [Schizophyllum commune Loenen D]|nr:hypothetical protein K525DRAFT_275386 [Schizophyllum commune Loenen D]